MMLVTSLLNFAFVAAIALIATSLTGCGEIDMRMEVAYTCTTESDSGCSVWTQSGIIGDKDEPDAFKVSVSYSCASVSSTTGHCKAWTQKGTCLKEGSSGCFPGSTTVLTRDGPKPMWKVNIG